MCVCVCVCVCAYLISLCVCVCVCVRACVCVCPYSVQTVTEFKTGNMSFSFKLCLKWFSAAAELLQNVTAESSLSLFSPELVML